MQKIYLKALELAGFKNAKEIVSIIMATPNPTIATEIILGCYVPNLEAFGFYKRNDTLYKVIEVDELNDIIKYEKYTQKTKTVYFASKEDRENDIYSDSRTNDYYSYKELPIAGTNTYEDSEKFESFMSGYNKKNRIEESEFVDTLMQWNYSGVV